MENLGLRDKDVFPSEDVLEKVLRDSYPAFEELNGVLSESGLKPEWNYYNDGKAWLCKMLFKKKNIGWLSLWDGFFKTTFYFTEKHLASIADLDIAENIKEDFCRAKPSGKLMPMIIEVYRQEQLKDILTIVRFKRDFK